MKRSKLTVIMVVLTISLLAGTVYAATAWTSYFVVERVYAGYSDGSIYIRALDSTDNPASCSSSDIHITSTNSDPDNVQSLAMAALLSGKKMSCKISTSSCSGSNVLGYQCVIDVNN